MFDNVKRELRRLGHGVRVPVQLALDDDGYLDRVCPSHECNVEFKVYFEDWRDKVRDDAVFCPICRFQAESGEWNTPEQIQQIKAVAVRHVQQRLNQAFTADATSFKRPQHADSLVNLSLSYRPSPLPILVPAGASEIMRQRSTCEKCGCRYSSVGAAFFCPACGHNSAVSTFDAAVDTVRKTVVALPAIRRTLAEAADQDTAENSVRQICESNLVRLVSAFERFAEALFETLPNRQQFSPRPNVFQNLQESSSLWRSATGVGYDDLLPASRLSALERFFQQRHLLVHNEGIVDQVYLDRSGDNRYAVGQRLVVRREAIEELAGLVADLAIALRNRE